MDHGKIQTEEDGKWLEQHKEELIANLSHELRTPLTIVKEALSQLQDGITGPLTEPQARIVQTANRNMDRLVQLVNEKLAQAIQQIIEDKKT
jgi:signal transduction histidine kinase